MNLREAVIGREYLVAEINTGDEELDSFLFFLGEPKAGNGIAVKVKPESSAFLCKGEKSILVIMVAMRM